MANTEFIYQVLDTNGEAWAVVIDIWKVFDRVWHGGLLHISLKAMLSG